MQTADTERKIFTLSDVTASIQRTLNERYRSFYWIKAEMIRLNHYRQSGHCFPDLVEKQNGRVVAQIKANIWSERFNIINDNFRKVLKEPLKDGIKILFLAKVNFHPEYGLSLNITDIDPNFTLGDLQRERLETIKRLQEEGVFHLNRNLKLPLLPQRIAIISEQSSKGYADFVKVFEEAKNQNAFGFLHSLFPSLLQGDRAVPALITQLRKIKREKDRFDLVVIVRGGGADLSLTCYDQYELAREIALFPLPVITGIGHATNLTVAEMVAHENAITPTRLAHFLLNYFQQFDDSVRKAEEIISGISMKILTEERLLVENTARYFRSVTGNLLQKNRHLLKENARSLLLDCKLKFRDEKMNIEDTGSQLMQTKNTLIRTFTQQLERQTLILEKDVLSGVKQFRQEIDQCDVDLQVHTKAFLKDRKAALEGLQKDVRNLDPKNVLRRGYSITVFNGKAVLNPQELTNGDELTTVLFEGEIKSAVTGKIIQI